MVDQTPEILAEIGEAMNFTRDHKPIHSYYPNGTGKPNTAAVAQNARTQCEYADVHGKLTWAIILQQHFWEVMAESDAEKLRDRLIQLATVAAYWVKTVDELDEDEDYEDDITS